MRNPFRPRRDEVSSEDHDRAFDDDPDLAFDQDPPVEQAAAYGRDPAFEQDQDATAGHTPSDPRSGLTRSGEVGAHLESGDVPDISDLLVPRPILSGEGGRSREVSGPGLASAEVEEPGPGGATRKWGPPETPGRRAAAAAPAGDGGLDESALAARAAARSEAIAEQKSAWTYLGVLGGLFMVLVVVGYGCSDQRTVEEVAVEQPGVVAGIGQQTSLVLTVDDDVITIEGVVPDQAAKDQLIGAAQSAYGAENVLDQLVVDEGVTLQGGTIRIVGSAALEDDRPAAILDQLSADFDLANRGNEVDIVDTTLTPVAATLTVDGDRITLNGVLPDEQSVSDLVAVAGEVWDADNIDSSGLSAGATTWTDGAITMVGSTSSTDERPNAFVGVVPAQIDTLVTVDTTALEIVDDEARRLEIQTEINDLIEENPIQFAPTLADIEAESDDTLVELAGLLEQVPTSSLEIVGYTDSVGNDQANLTLSEDRATAVVDRLVELGIDEERMTSRGEGENDPVGDNSTDAGRALNRRIEITLLDETDTSDG